MLAPTINSLLSVKSIVSGKIFGPKAKLSFQTVGSRLLFLPVIGYEGVSIFSEILHW